MRNRFLLVVVACGLWASSAAPAQSCGAASCFGPAAADPLVVSGSFVIAADALLDFGPRHVMLTGAQWSFLGSATILAAKLTLDPASSFDLDEAAASAGGPPAQPLVVAVTLTAANGHDGAAVFGGPVDLGVSPTNAPAAPAAFLVTADGAVSATSIVTDGDPLPAGWVMLSGASVAVGAISASSTGFDGPQILLNAIDDVTVGTVTSVYAEVYAGASYLVTAGGDYLQTGPVTLLPLPAVFIGPSYAVNAGGTAIVLGAISTGDASPAPGGSIQIVAAGDVQWHGSAQADGGDGGRIFVRSTGGDVVLSGAKSTLATAAAGAFSLGSIFFDAARDLVQSGIVSGGSFVPGPRSNLTDAGGVTLRAGREMRVASGGTIGSTAFGVGTVAHDVTLSGCRVVVEPGASVLVCNSPSIVPDTEGSVRIEVGDHVVLDGAVSAQCAANNPGSVSIDGRLPAVFGWSGAAMPTPAPLYTFDPTRPPCLADFTTEVSAPSPVALGATLGYAVTGPAGLPVFAAVATTPAAISLGAFGFTQIDGFGAALRLADALGVLGPPLPGSTNAAGAWTFSIAVPPTPALSGATLIFESYLFDSAAPNGLFHQPRAATIVLN